MIFMLFLIANFISNTESKAVKKFGVSSMTN